MMRWSRGAVACAARLGGMVLAVGVVGSPALVHGDGQASNLSYATLCAEVDNVNVPMAFTNVTSFRIVATHPLYYPAAIDESGPDFGDCTFNDDRIWIIGTNNGSDSELRSSGFGNNDEYYPQDNPAAGWDEAWSSFPKEINNDWMNSQYIKFTADESNDVNTEIRIGARLTVDFWLISGTLEIKARTWNGSGWTDQGSRYLSDTNLTANWDIPDFSWQPGTDGNNIHLDVVTAAEGGASSSGAWAIYDYLELRKRTQAGETVHAPIYDDGKVKVEAVSIDFWWRAPEAMTLNVAGSTQTNIHYFRVIKKVAGTSSWPEVFVLYEDGNARIIPHPQPGQGGVPYGSSVILGPSTNSARPYAGISSVTLNPTDLCMTVTYEDASTAHVELHVDRDRHVVDVSEVTYATTNLPFARFRSMWVYDGKADCDRIEAAAGAQPIIGQGAWSSLSGSWWQFYRDVASYHNTHSPDIRVEVTGPSQAFLALQAESFDAATNCTVTSRTNATGGQALLFAAATGGSAIYTTTVAAAQSNVSLKIRYADADGGDNGDTLGNSLSVYWDGVLQDTVYSANSGGWDAFEDSPSVLLGNVAAGSHELKIVAGAGTSGIEVDQVELIAQPVAAWTKHSLLTQQAESCAASNQALLAWRASASGGKSMAMQTNSTAWLQFTHTLTSAWSNVYLQVRYSDDVAPNKVDVYVDGTLKGQFPTLDTGTWDDFAYGPELYLGTLSSGTHTVKVQTSTQTWGVDLDQYELYRYAP
jgi:hypothetical protein